LIESRSAVTRLQAAEVSLRTEAERLASERNTAATELIESRSAVTRLQAAEVSLRMEAERLASERDTAATELIESRSAVTRLQAAEVSLRTEAATAQETNQAEVAVAEQHIEQLAKMVMSFTSASEVGSRHPSQLCDVVRATMTISSPVRPYDTKMRQSGFMLSSV